MAGKGDAVRKETLRSGTLGYLPRDRTVTGSGIRGYLPDEVGAGGVPRSVVEWDSWIPSS